MKTALALIFVFSTLAVAAEDGQDTPAKRVASVTWNTQTGKLEWVVESGVLRNEEFVPSSEVAHYEITPEQAMMAFQNQQRGFTEQEATWLKGLLHVLTVYCAESTMWWDSGQGDPLDPGKPKVQPPAGQPPAEKSGDPDTAPHKVINPPQRKAPGAVQLIAVRMIE